MKIYDVTRELLSTPVYPGDPVPELTAVQSMEKGDICNLSKLSLCLHNATHVDAPLHFVQDGASIDRINPEIFVGKCRILPMFDADITGEDIEGADLSGIHRVIFKGFGKARLTKSAAWALLDRNIWLIGIDHQTVGAEGEEAEVHQILQRERIVLLEGLDLKGVPSGDYVLSALPLKIAGAEAAPCRAILMKAE